MLPLDCRFVFRHLVYLLCCQFLWIVVLFFFILCTPYVASGLSFCFSSSCVPPMLPVSLDCRFVFLHLVYLLCCLWIVVLFFFILCTPYVASGLSFCFSSSCVPPMLPVSLDFRFVFLHLVYPLCCQFLWIVVLFFFILCTPYLCCQFLWIFVLFFFILCTLYAASGLSFCFSSSCVPPMLPLDCRFVFRHLVFLLCCQFLWSVVLFSFILCTSYVASGLSFCFSSSCVPPMLPLDCRFVFLHLVYPLCCQFLWIFVLFFFILCTSYVASFSGLSFCFSSSCVPPIYVASFSGFSFYFSSSCVPSMLPLDCRFVFLHLVYPLCCQFLWIFVLFFFILCTPYVASGLSFCFSSSCVPPMLPLDCRFVFLHLVYPLCCQFLWIFVLFFFILCTPYVASGLSFCFSSSCVPPMLPVSLDFRFVFLHLVYLYVARFSGLSFCFSSSCVPPILPVSLDFRFVFLHLVYPLCCLWIIVLFFFILCTPYVASFSGFSFCFSSSCVPPMLPLDCRFVFRHLVYLLCCQFLWIAVLFFFILCTSYVARFSGLSFCFSSSCVPPMLPVSLDCRFVFLHLVYPLCCQFLWIFVLFFFILCTPYVASGLSFCFSSSCVPPMLPVSLDCRFVLLHLVYLLCCQILWIVVLFFFILCTSYVASFSGFSFCFSSSCVPPMLPLDYRFVFRHLVYLLCCQFLWIAVLNFFILCTLYVASGLSFCFSSSCVPPMLPVSLDFRFVFLHLVYPLCCLWIVVLFFFILCTPYVASGLSFCFSSSCVPPMLPVSLDFRFVFLHLVYPLCCLWIVVLFFVILCTSYVASFSGLPFCFSSSCVPLCCQILWIVVLFFVILCTSYFASFSGFSFCFSSSCVPPMLPLDYRFVFLHLVYPLCCQFLWIFVLFFFILCTPYVASGLSFCFSSSCVPPMLPVSLDCRFVFLHLVYLLCCQILWIVVLFFFILCTSYVASFSGLSFCFSSSCVPPMLPVSLDFRFVFLHLVYPLCCLWIVVLFFVILCTSYVASFSGLPFCFSSSCVPPMLPDSLDCRFVFLHLVYLLCCQFFWIFVLFFFILCTPYVASGLSFCFSSSCVPPMLPVSLDCRFVFLHLVYLLCCQILWIVVLFFFILCTSYVASFSGLSF